MNRQWDPQTINTRTGLHVDTRLQIATRPALSGTRSPFHSTEMVMSGGPRVGFSPFGVYM
jgi:hypothetical protein